VQNAEAALKEAKTSGEQYLHHRIEMNSELARRVGMEHRLRAALENKEFVLHYQPKVTLRTGKIASVEALLRWNDAEHGLILPTTLLPILESAGLMPAVGAWVLRQAAADCRHWRRLGISPIRVAVNVSPPELRRRNVAREILEGIGDLTGDSPWGVDIEITEGALFGDSSSCVHALRLLRAAGVRVAIDDLGTGFSSLGRLSELPIDILKIDRIFTSRLPTDRKSCTLVYDHHRLGACVRHDHSCRGHLITSYAKGAMNRRASCTAGRCRGTRWNACSASQAPLQRRVVRLATRVPRDPKRCRLRVERQVERETA
jgi:EAL domain-containing protein (putative c-di-GMP-specific phosphodiesterase class I)